MGTLLHRDAPIRRLSLALILLACLTVFLLIFRVNYALNADVQPWTPHDGQQTTNSEASSADLSQPQIPNIAHYVYILEDPSANLTFRFSQFLSMAAARHYFQPTTIYLHTNAQDGVLRQAKAGLNGLWSKLILEMPGVQVRKAVAPSHARNGQNITIVEHKSDFVRVEAVLKYGGVYMDFDAHPLRDVRVLRHAGFQGIVGRQLGGEVMSGTFMSTKGSKMMQRWAEDMHQVYDGGWTTHSNAVINRVAEKLVAEPGEALIMEREAFGPGSWTPEDCIKLYGLHDDTFNMNLTGTTQRVELGQSQTNPSWAIDWSKNYFLHAFSPSRTGTHIDGFDQITPKYVLERRSNFAIAVYPIARKMFEQRLYNIDDPY